MTTNLIGFIGTAKDVNEYVHDIVMEVTGSTSYLNNPNITMQEWFEGEKKEELEKAKKSLRTDLYDDFSEFITAHADTFLTIGDLLELWNEWEEQEFAEEVPNPLA